MARESARETLTSSSYRKEQRETFERIYILGNIQIDVNQTRRNFHRHVALGERGRHRRRPRFDEMRDGRESRGQVISETFIFPLLNDLYPQ